MRTKTLFCAWSLPCCLVPALLLSSPCAASVSQADQDQLRAALEEARRVDSTADLIRLAAIAPFNTAFVREGLAYVGASASLKGEIVADSEITKDSLKLLTFAAILDLASRAALDRWPAGEPLYGTGPEALAAFQSQRSLPNESNDPLLALLRHLPSIDDRLQGGDYQYLRIDRYIDGVSVLAERTDVPWRGLGPTWTTTKSALEPSRGRIAVPAEGASFVLHLNQIHLLVATAKVYLILSRLEPGSPLAKYCWVAVGSAFFGLSQSAGSTDPCTFARAALSSWDLATRKLQSEPTQGADWQLLEFLESRRNSARFYAKDFSGALKVYEVVAADPSRTDEVRARAAWGVAVCQLALHGNYAKVLHRSLDLLRVSSENVLLRYTAATLTQLLGVEAILTRSDERKLFAPVLASWTDIQGADRYQANHSVWGVLATIDRSDLAIPMLLSEIARIHGHTDHDSRIVERDYLTELGAFVGDAFAHLSWRKGQGCRAQPRLSDAAAWARCFPTTPLDLAVRQAGLAHQGMLAPEEDRATTVAFYGRETWPSADSSPDQVLKLFAVGPSKQQPGGSPKAFADWATTELARTPPNPVPLLKLVWIEWGYGPLYDLTTSEVDIANWLYRPLTGSGLTNPEDLKARLGSLRNGFDPDVKEVWELLRTVHNFLETTYPARQTTAPSSTPRK